MDTEIKEISIPSYDETFQNYITESGIQWCPILKDPDRTYVKNPEYYDTVVLFFASYKIWKNMNLADATFIRAQIAEKYKGQRFIEYTPGERTFKLRLSTLRSALDVRIQHLKKAIRLRDQRKTDVQKQQAIQTRYEDLVFKLRLVYKIAVRIADTLIPLKGTPEFERRLDQSGRFLATLLYEIDMVYIGLETQDYYRQRKEGNPTYEHFFPRQFAGTALLNRLCFMNERDRRFERFISLFYTYIQVVKATPDENKRACEYQNGDHIDPARMYELAGIPPLVRVKDSYHKTVWRMIMEEFGVNLHIYDEFPEISREEADQLER